MLEAFIIGTGVVSAIVAIAACIFYPVKGEKSKVVFGFKVRDNA